MLGKWEITFNGIDFLSGMMKMFWHQIVVTLHNLMNTLKITGLHSLSELFVWYVSYISIKLFFLKKNKPVYCIEILLTER